MIPVLYNPSSYGSPLLNICQMTILMSPARLRVTLTKQTKIKDLLTAPNVPGLFLNHPIFQCVGVIAEIESTPVMKDRPVTFL